MTKGLKQKKAYHNPQEVDIIWYVPSQHTYLLYIMNKDEKNVTSAETLSISTLNKLQSEYKSLKYLEKDFLNLNAQFAKIDATNIYLYKKDIEDKALCLKYNKDKNDFILNTKKKGK